MTDRIRPTSARNQDDDSSPSVDDRDDQTIVSEPASTAGGRPDDDDPPVIEVERVAEAPGGGGVEDHDEATIVSEPADLHDPDDDGADVDLDTDTIVHEAAVVGESPDSDPPSTFVGVERTPSGSEKAIRMSDLRGRSIGRFLVVERLGKGGMGSVFLGRDESLDRDVAIKVISRKLARSKTFVERFRREAKMMAKIDHKHVVRVIEHGVAFGLNYIVMDLVRGPDDKPTTVADMLSDLRKRKKRMSMDESIKFILQACDALDEAHEKGIVHRDIKPGNMLVDSRGDIRLADFGIASDQASEVRHTSAQSGMGTGAYMAPEQARNPRDVDRRADVYSLGTVLYELLAGQLPEGSYKPIPSIRRDVPKALDEVIVKARQAQPKDRYKSAAALAAAVRKAAAATLAQRLKVWGFYAAIVAVATAVWFGLTRQSMEERWWEALTDGDLATMQALLRDDGSLLNSVNTEQQSRTALIEATTRTAVGHPDNGYEAIVEWLAEAASLDDQDLDENGNANRTALMYAAERNEVRLVGTLMDRGASITTKDKDGRTAEDLASLRGHDEVVMALALQPLIEAARLGQTERMKQIMRQTPDLVHYRSSNGNVTLLHMAAYNGYVEAVRVLLEEGLDVDARTSAPIDRLDFGSEDITLQEGATPLLAAVIRGHETVVDDLLENGALADRAGADNRRPLMFAVESDNLHIATSLIQTGEASRLFSDDDGRPLLVVAIDSGAQLAMIELLVTAGGQVDASIRDGADPAGRTPLMAAIDRNDCAIAAFLLEQNAAASNEELELASARGGCMEDIATQIGIEQREALVREVVKLIQKGSVAEVTDALADDPAIKSQSADGLYLIHWAIREAPIGDRLRMVEALLDAGAPYVPKAAMSRTEAVPTLSLVVRTKDAELWSLFAQRLAEESPADRQALLEKKDSNGESVLFEAVRNAPILVDVVLDELSTAGVRPIDVNEDLETAMDVAITMHLVGGKNRIGAIRSILSQATEEERRTLVGGRPDDDRPPLHQSAAHADGRALVKILIDSGADLFDERAGKIVAETAHADQQEQIMRLSLDALMKDTASDRQRREAMMGRIIDVNRATFQEELGSEFCERALEDKRGEFLSLLLDQDAPVTAELARDSASRGLDMLKIVSLNGTRDVASETFTGGAANTGNTLLHVAANNPDAGVARDMVDRVLEWAGRNNVSSCSIISKTNTAGDNACFVAAERGHWTVVEHLLTTAFGLDGRDCDLYAKTGASGRSLAEQFDSMATDLEAWRDQHPEWFPPVDMGQWAAVTSRATFADATREFMLQFDEQQDTVFVYSRSDQLNGHRCTYVTEGSILEVHVPGVGTISGTIKSLASDGSWKWDTETRGIYSFTKNR